MRFLKNFFRKKRDVDNDFSYFFLNSSSKEKKKVFKKVIKGANTDQRTLVESNITKTA